MESEPIVAKVEEKVQALPLIDPDVAEMIELLDDSETIMTGSPENCHPGGVAGAQRELDQVKM